MLSAAIAIANAVQFSACSGVLRVLGLARAGPGDIALRVFWPATPNMELWAAPRFVGTEGGRECGGHVAGWNPAGRVPHGEATLDFFLRAWKSSGATGTGPMFLCEQIKWLLGQGADASGCDTLGNTPLFLAVNLSDAWLAMPAVSLLLEEGAIANLAATHRACSPLHVALILGRSQVAMELIRFGVAPLPSTTPLPPEGRLVRLAESPNCRDTVHAYMLLSAEVYFRANDIVALRSLSEHGMPLASDATLCTLVLHRNDEVCLAIQGGMPP